MGVYCHRHNITLIKNEIPPIAEINMNEAIMRGLQMTQILVSKKRREVVFIMIWAKFICKNAAVINRHTYPSLIKQQDRAPYFRSVKGYTASTPQSTFVAIPCIKQITYKAHIAAQQRMVMDSTLKVGHQTILRVQGIVYQSGGLSESKVFMNGTRLLRSYSARRGSCAPGPVGIPICWRPPLWGPWFLPKSLNPCTFAILMYYIFYSIIMNSNRKNNTSASRSPGKISTPSHFHTHQLLHLLQSFRKQLTDKLQAYDLIHASQSPPTCLNHDSFISLYNQSNHCLQCAVCFTKNDKNINKPKPSVVPVEKSEEKMRKDLKQMSLKIEKQLGALSKIQDILYLGFENEKSQFEKKMAQIEEIYDKIIEKAKKQYCKAKQILFQKYIEERNKHQIVLKEITLLQTLVSQYAAYMQSNEQQNQQYHHINFQPTNQGSGSKKDKKQEQKKKQAIIWEHLIKRQLANSLNFSSNGLKWNFSLHRNNIKILGEMQISKAKDTLECLTQRIDHQTKKIILSDYQTGYRSPHRFG